MADISFVLCDDGEGLSFVHLRDGADEVEFLYNEIFVLQPYFKSGIDLKDGACVVDVGANIGFFSLYCARKYSNSAMVY